MHVAAMLVALGIVTYAVVFASLAVQNHDNFGTWSYDLGIYDQATWLLSRFGRTFMSVRGMDVWGHHFNPILYLFAPLYWLGAGPATLYALQSVLLALGAAPLYLIGRDRMRSPWAGFVLAVVYLLYTPIQFISWAMFHPEALVVTPFLFAWWFAMRRQWRWYAAMVLICLLIREDVALAVMMLGVAIAIIHFNAWDRRTVLRVAATTFAAGAVWYLVTTRFVIPHFNHDRPPFYVQMFYGEYGKDMTEVVGTILRHPQRVIQDAIKEDRRKFYRDLLLPMGGMPLAGPVGLLMAGPQLLASVIGGSPYARMIHYQYTSVMIAPLAIAAAEGLRLFWIRRRIVRVCAALWIIGCAYVTNVDWSPSPLGSRYGLWAKPQPRHAAIREAIRLLPANASVSASYGILPHISHRRAVYDWPNPFIASVWGDMDCVDLPDPRTVEYVLLDRGQTGEQQNPMIEAMLAPGGAFRVVFQRDGVILAQRQGTDPEVDVRPQEDSCRNLAR